MLKAKKANKSRRISYKYFIGICIAALLGVIIIAFSGYSYYNFRNKSLEIASKEIEYTASRVVTSVDERLDNLRQYYLMLANEDEITRFLNSDMDYSNYASYKQLSKKMQDNSLFGDYLRGYTLANFDKNWVISSKGIYSMDDMINAATLNDINGMSTEETDNWYYNPYVTKVRTSDRNYRLSADTGGLSLVIKLPTATVSNKGMMLVNVDMDMWENWIVQNLDNSDEYVVVLGADGTLVYSNNSILADKCMEIQKTAKIDDPKTSAFKIDGAQYVMSCENSQVLGWKYYCISNLSSGMIPETKLVVTFLLIAIVLGAFAFALIFYLTYQPVKRFLKNVSNTDGPINGNEFDYIEGKFTDLKNDKELMEMILDKNHEKLQEMFELRLIRGEVKSQDEWEEYTSSLNLSKFKYYASAVIVLNLKEEEAESLNVNEDAICLSIIDNLNPELKAMLWMPPVYNSCAIFMLFADDDESGLLEKINLFYDETKKHVAETTGYKILMGVSATHTDRKHINAAYRESINALTMENVIEQSEGNGSEELINRQDCHFYLNSVAAHDDTYNNSYEKEIGTAVINMDKDACYRIIDEFSAFIGEMKSYDEATVYIVRMIDSILISAINTKVNLADLYPAGVGKLYRRITEINETGRVRRSLKMLLIDPIIAHRKKLLEDNSYRIMEQIERKIRETKGNITLQECADELNITTAYIWKVLKMERNKTFSEYQEEYKLEEAKRLLLQSNKSVADIAAELSYTNAQNFIRFFSKGTGVTPGKFRKLY